MPYEVAEDVEGIEQEAGIDGQDGGEEPEAPVEGDEGIAEDDAGKPDASEKGAAYWRKEAEKYQKSYEEAQALVTRTTQAQAERERAGNPPRNLQSEMSIKRNQISQLEVWKDEALKGGGVIEINGRQYSDAQIRQLLEGKRDEYEDLKDEYHEERRQAPLRLEHEFNSGLAAAAKKHNADAYIGRAREIIATMSLEELTILAAKALGLPRSKAKGAVLDGSGRRGQPSERTGAKTHSDDYLGRLRAQRQKARPT